MTEPRYRTKPRRPPPAKKPATGKRNSTAGAPDAAQKKASGAVAASILTAAYHMLIDGTLYHDLAPDHFDRRAKAAQTRRLVTRLQNLGYAVQITPLAA